ncbi:hypothetical protein BASA50_004104 [Batrachochytrium salamandrivorans]|uniref:Cwf19-like C-terminal domain-containing protein n=1 Tax=Batrachochytrium salamandrivorans TaxID=1357716 RepID=A0ABQ8FGK6_9FUNG|nr:hypothetical protein BASA50_004104 [Batrachochytrium salamandrivorans]KAH9257226.1 hypothetical protein BASA81_004615 [Batrachochytrium salamandrivorans]KAJ1343801.1 hypothetical protein BSLG_001612 [Batrachochytrium salamandrivorans]
MQETTSSSSLELMATAVDSTSTECHGKTSKTKKKTSKTKKASKTSKTSKSSKTKKTSKKSKGSKGSNTSRSSDSDPSDSDGAIWVERISSNPQHTREIEPPSNDTPSLPVLPLPTADSTTQPITRPDWMVQDELVDMFGLKEAPSVRKSEKQIQKEADDARRLAIRKERELNPTYFADSGNNVDGSAVTTPNTTTVAASVPAPVSDDKRAYSFGDRGANWRMMKLKRVFDLSKEEGLSVESVALERYGSMDLFQQALDERSYLDKQKGVKPRDSLGSYQPSIRSASGFQRPDSSTTLRTSLNSQPLERSEDKQRDPVSMRRTAIPLALAPVLTDDISTLAIDDEAILTNDQLNKLNAKIIKAKLMRLPTLKALEEEYRCAKERSDARASASTKNQANTSNRDNRSVVVVPAVNDRGKLYDLGSGSSQSGAHTKRKMVEQDTHDAAGNRIKYSRAEQDETLADMVFQEKTGAGTTFDQDIADRISRDATFKDDLDYMDDGADNLAKKKEISNDLKCRFAIDNFKKSQSAIDKCPFCFRNGEAPHVSVISLGVKVYLSLPETVDMVPGHCLIVPVQHTLTTLELEDDTWDEIRNFQKSLLQMTASTNQGVIFMEQVINFNWHKHTVIECIPVPLTLFEDASGYFKEALNSVEEEWSQHKKIIVTDRGFRRSMVPNLPYFHVWFGLNRGFGHVIENADEWQPWFGREVLASVLDLPPDRWRKPRRAPPNESGQRLARFRAKWSAFDWTKLLDT